MCTLGDIFGKPKERNEYIVIKTSTEPQELTLHFMIKNDIQYR